MPSRNVSFLGENIQQSKSVASFFPTRWSNYALAVWSLNGSVMLRLELYESWSEENFVWFKRVPQVSLAELQRRLVGTTEWTDEAIVVQGTKIIAPGPPYASKKRLHLFWPNHQCFVEELASVITMNPPPQDSPSSLPLYRGPEALVNLDSRSPAAISFQIGKGKISDDWTGGNGMLYAYPGGPSRHK